MNKLSILAAVLLAIANHLPAPVIEASPQAADEKKMTVTNYSYLLPPEKAFEAPPRSWLQNATVIDKENGYMSVTGDGAQPSFEVALFGYRDGRPLLAICQGELEGDDRVGLSFFELGSNGKCTNCRERFFRSAINGVPATTTSGMRIFGLSCRDMAGLCWSAA